MPQYEVPRVYHFKVEFLEVPGVTDNDVRFQDVSGLAAEMGIEEILQKKYHAGINR